LLKGRFRRLKYVNMKYIEEICKTIVAACVLHNICIMEHDGFEDILNNEDNNQVQCNDPQFFMQNDAEGQLKRINITNRLLV